MNIAIPEAVMHGAHGLFFLAAVAVAVICAWLGGRKEEPVRWSLMIAVVMTGFVVGSKVYALVGGGFEAIHAAHQTGKSMLGGVLGAALGLVLFRQVLGYRGPEARAWALALPTAVLVGRIGCLLAGCCHGTVTHSWPGIIYPAGSAPFMRQLASGQLASGATASLPVHPAQLYEILFLICLVALVASVRGRLKRDNSLFTLMAGLYCVFRFAHEFVRWGGEPVMGLKPVQWGLAAFAGLFFVALALSEKGLVRDPSNDKVRAAHRLPGAAAVLLSLLACAWAWSTPLERMTLAIGAAPALAWLAVAVSRSLPAKVARLLPDSAAAAGALSVMLLLPTAMMPVGDKDKRNDVLRFELGGGGGQFEYEEICGDERFKDRFGAARASMAWRTQVAQKQTIEAGVAGYFVPVARVEGPQAGSEGSEDPDLFRAPVLWAEGAAPYRYYGLEPHLIWDFDWGALGAGLHAFVLSVDSATRKFDSFHLFPSAYLRAGPKDVGFLEASLLHGPHSPANMSVQFGAGAAITPQLTLRAGYAAPNNIYIEPTIKLPAKSFTMELIPQASFSVGSDDHFYYFGFTAALELPLR